jgi:hypothetical protein
MVMIVVTEPPEGTFRLDVLKVTAGPDGLTAELSVTVPVKLLVLEILVVDVAEDPA